MGVYEHTAPAAISTLRMRDNRTATAGIIIAKDAIYLSHRMTYLNHAQLCHGIILDQSCCRTKYNAKNKDKLNRNTPDICS